MSDSGDAGAGLLQVRGLLATAVRCAELEVRSGQCVALSGASGSGKTRLFRAIADLDPNEGEVTLAGKKFWRFRYTRPNTSQLPPTKRRNRLSLGEYPNPVSLSDARVSRDAFRSAVSIQRSSEAAA